MAVQPIGTSELGPGGKEIHHGNTVAAWVGCVIIFVGFVVGGVAFPAKSLPLFIGGCALVVIGFVTGGILHLMGFGQRVKEPSQGVTGGN
jgi:ABC-type multidrug transport system permease subunit